MMKKLTALLLALLMLVLPVLSCAATTDEIMANAKASGKGTRTVVTFVPGDLTMFLGAENQAIYSDVLDALGLTVYNNGKDGGQGGLAVFLQGNEVLNADVAVDDAGTFYLKSNALGSDTIAVNTNEWQPLLEKLIDLMTAAEAFTASEAAELKAQLAAVFAADGAAIPTADKAFANVDWKPVETLMTELMASAVTEAVTEQPEGCDRAAAKVTMTFKPEDVVRLYQVLADCLKADADAMAYLNSEFASSGMTAEDFLTQMVEAVKEASASMEDIPAVYYVSVAGNIVRVDAQINMDMEGEKLTMPIVYTRETLEQGVMHTVKGTADVNGAELVVLNGTYMDAGDAGLVAGNITMTPDEDDKMVLTADCVFDDKNVDFSMDIKVTESGAEQQIGMTLVTAETDHTTDVKFNMNVTADGENMSIGVNAKDEQTPGETSASGKGSLEMAITASSVTMSLVGDYTTTAEATAEGAKKDTACDLKLTVLGMEIPLLSINMATETCEPHDSIVSADAVHPAAMSDEELEAWGAQVAQSAQIALITVVQNLPASVLQLLMAQ